MATLTPPSEAVTLIGSGLTGPLLAISLADRGFASEIFERRPDPRQVHLAAGRSINLAISTRGIYALQQAGLWESMQRIVVPMTGRMMHAVSGELTFQPYGKDETEVINSISRADLNAALMNSAEARGVKLHFHERCLGYNYKSGVVRLRNEDTALETSIQRSTVIACDGASSAVRLEMFKLGRFNFSQQFLDYGYKELTIPAGPHGEHLIEQHALHIWPRGSYMLIALPNIDGTFACILFLPFEGEISFANLDSEDKVTSFFELHFPDAVPLMPHLVRNYFANPTGSMVTIRCSPWHADGKMLLLGDAAHAIVPFFGQGMNCAFEDCTCLLELLDREGPNWERIFEEFEQSRKQDTDAIADLALENFIEMRDLVADPRFLLKKQVELALEAKYPRLFVPKYAMVTFHRIPYSVARRRGEIQDRMLEELCGTIHQIDDLDWEKAGRLIHRYLTPLENY